MAIGFLTILPVAPGGLTPYARSGDLSVVLILILGGGLLAGAGRYRRHPK